MHLAGRGTAAEQSKPEQSAQWDPNRREAHSPGSVSAVLPWLPLSCFPKGLPVTKFKNCPQTLYSLACGPFPSILMQTSSPKWWAAADLNDKHCIMTYTDHLLHRHHTGPDSQTALQCDRKLQTSVTLLRQTLPHTPYLTYFWSQHFHYPDQDPRQTL